MTKFHDPRKLAELQEVAIQYADYKGLRAILRAEHDRQLADQMAGAKENFATFLQSKIDRDGYPYTITIADLMRAMGTSNRGTVLELVKDARQRAEQRRLDNFINAPLPLEIISYENTARSEHDNHAVAYMFILMDGKVYRLMYLDGEVGRTIRYQEFEFETIDGVITPGNTSKGREVRRLLPLGWDDKDKGAVPEWLYYAVSTDEWKSIAPHFTYE